jgi:hypothetical protein
MTSLIAVGRTTFWDAVADYEAKKATRQEAVSRIAQRFREWAVPFESAHRAEAARSSGEAAAAHQSLAIGSNRSDSGLPGARG